MENFKQENRFLSQDIEEGKTIAIIAYITVIGLIVAFVMNSDKKNKYAAFHIRQSLGIGITGLALGVVNIIPILGWIVSIVGVIFVFAMWLSVCLAPSMAKALPFSF